MLNIPENLAQRIALMLDYDGTLTPIVSNPQDARITSDKLDTLKQLIHHPEIQVAIVSGRSVEQLETFLGDLTDFSVILCGLHGGEIVQYPERKVLKSPCSSIPEDIAQFKKELQLLFEGQKSLEKVVLEDKKYSLAMHYRNADEDGKALAVQCFCAVFQAIDENLEHFKPQGGKEVLEIIPKDFSKGTCAEFLMNLWERQTPQDQSLYPIYIGDDLTDEAAFTVVNRMQGTSIRVGENNCKTHALNTVGSVNLLYYGLSQLLLKPSLRRLKQ